MTLSLDDVRNKRFRMARKSGYEVLEVDNFVDEVEESFAQLLEENQNLRKQVESLRSRETSAAAPAPAPVDAPAREGAPQTAIVVTTSKEASAAVVRLVELSTEQAERLVAEATADAVRIREEANQTAEQVTTDARAQAQRVESEALVHAERVNNDAVARAEELDRQIEERRRELIEGLEQERDSLNTAVNDLRSFEAAYRMNLTSHLRSQIELIEAGRAEPGEVPPLAAPHQPQARSTDHVDNRSDEGDLDEGDSHSDTPRLDALLGDQR